MKATHVLVEDLQRRLEEQPNGCIEYVGHRLARGYGKISIGEGAHALTHRLAWTLFKGPIPAGMVVCHKCDNPPCCNVEHLFLGTQKDNLRDMVRKGRGRQPVIRTHCKHGHEYTTENTLLEPNGAQVCRECRRARGRVYNAKRARKKAS